MLLFCKNAYRVFGTYRTATVSKDSPGEQNEGEGLTGASECVSDYNLFDVGSMVMLSARNSALRRIFPKEVLFASIVCPEWW